MVAIILVCVPLADAEKLNVTQLLSIPTGLLLFLVLWETFGSLQRGARPVESWKYEKPSRNEAEDRRRADDGQNEEICKIDE
jgi:hypothetical protein